ncbi:Ig-like domain-containing protein [Fodinibius sediminis]|uniref:Uncharacterized conserved protein n=1 Tax=Fodinibius sediminis TaxID=1214077 RepID=A0A521BWD5_9BACT|nr:Ig-like domain-containing protein [Fodinibius sediminis]SMO51504.1 Uncharacterized conserved protein [Fodinibius sediminis]
MNIIQRLLFLCLFGALLTITAAAAHAQATDDYRLVVTPEALTLEIDDRVQLSGHIEDRDGAVVRDSVLFYSYNRESVSVSSNGLVKALKPGTFQLRAVAAAPNEERLSVTIPVEVTRPPITDITFTDTPGHLYEGTRNAIDLVVTDAKGFRRDPSEVTFVSSDSSIASMDDWGRLYALKAGTVRLTARAGEAAASWEVEVRPNPTAMLELTHHANDARTGDVIRFIARPRKASGDIVQDIPIDFSFTAHPGNEPAEGARAQIAEDGRFVANKAGLYTVVARAGNVAAEQTIRVDARNIQKDLRIAGHGLVNEVHTSDLWVWEGIDGRDYAVTGTWGGNGEAYFWDVTNPSRMTIIDTVTVDARTVNDVKISDDGRIGVITREGASDRKNGIVILDVRDPHNVEVITEYTDGLTGGVHNAFIYEDHVFAVNNGRRYDIIDISNPRQPETVGRFELDTPGHAIHDVWVENGIAYSSNWDDGVVAVDVGSTPAADSPEHHDIGAGSFSNPVKLGSYAYPNGWNHAAFPFKSRSTGDFYVVAGDEAFPNGLYVKDKPTVPAGWIHFIKFEGGWDNPREVARYQVPEAGTHNFWVKGDKLYVAYYNAGLRVVDISGELMGNLYEQGREIARFLPTHHNGRIPNAPMSWGPQPHKEHIFVSDWNSGIWALEIQD